MRVIAGKYKGREVRTPKGIRPTQDKVKKALFDILGDLDGVSFLELYAGSGAIGFEALSRGASELTLVEYNRDCVRAINENIRTLQLKACRLYAREVAEALERFFRDKRRFDIVFMDPPYHKEAAKKTLQTLGAYDILTADGFIVVEHFKKDALPETVGSLALFRQKKYSDTLLSFYKKRLV
ncbi:MAG: 16S rRNA (guanine(966)-N(2))-methyltransferase RsmD [Candidatus Omnitrophota bacterium]|jgi:16S rRNA (guanine(966)-N(2))-methyltransferase RsmD|nr:MAG: 16S rRNA (guanine(966)-N(2))-methyltransferase RsmD [Candidatus Omnitrophota bacterium]